MGSYIGRFSSERVSALLRRDCLYPGPVTSSDGILSDFVPSRFCIAHTLQDGRHTSREPKERFLGKETVALSHSKLRQSSLDSLNLNLLTELGRDPSYMLC